MPGKNGKYNIYAGLLCMQIQKSCFKARSASVNRYKCNLPKVMSVHKKKDGSATYFNKTQVWAFPYREVSVKKTHYQDVQLKCLSF